VTKQMPDPEKPWRELLRDSFDFVHAEGGLFALDLEYYSDRKRKRARCYRLARLRDRDAVREFGGVPSSASVTALIVSDIGPVRKAAPLVSSVGISASLSATGRRQICQTQLGREGGVRSERSSVGSSESPKGNDSFV
jgi:hypothetical protein